MAPTVPILAPRLDALAQPLEFARLNGLTLRNTSVVNLIDGCAVTLPLEASSLAIGLMLIGPTTGDARLLAIAEAAEPVLRRSV